jgi:nitrogen fixation NifU-like protein
VYTEKVMDHFRNPRNVGVIDNADGVGEVGNPVCGDMMTFYIKVKEGVITDVKYQTFGCGAAIAVSSMISELTIGKTLEEARNLTNNMVAEALGGLPEQKHHCSNLGADALHKAIEDYMAKHSDALLKKENKQGINTTNINGRNEMAKPKIDKDCCTGCGICIDSCPTNSLELVDDISSLVRPDTCTGCAACADACPLECIKMEE